MGDANAKILKGETHTFISVINQNNNMKSIKKINACGRIKPIQHLAINYQMLECWHMLIMKHKFQEIEQR